jgi:RNA-directed DNA polymerase
MQRARARIREITAPRRLLLGVEVIVQDLNNYLRGLGELFPVRGQPPSLHPHHYLCTAATRLVVAKRHKRRTGCGMTVVAFVAPNRMGLVNLDRLVVTPQPLSGLARQAEQAECRR